MPLLLLAATVGWTACASSQPSSGEGVPRPGERLNNTTIAGLSSTVTLRMVEDITVRADTLAHAPESLWPHLESVYRQLGVPSSRVDASARVVANPAFREHRRLGDERLSRYFRCGAGLTGENADQYPLQIEAVSQLVPTEAGGTAVLTYVGATARPHGVSSDGVRCTSRGELEDRVVEGLLSRVGEEGTAGG